MGGQGSGGDYPSWSGTCDSRQENGLDGLGANESVGVDHRLWKGFSWDRGLAASTCPQSGLVRETRGGVSRHRVILIDKGRARLSQGLHSCSGEELVVAKLGLC